MNEALCTPTHPVDAPEKIGLAFRANFLRRLGVESAQGATLLTVSDDSMAPALRRGDTVIVATAQRELREGLVYGVVIAGRLALRRFQAGAVFACSHGTLTPEGSCRVLGRVVYRSGLVA